MIKKTFSTLKKNPKIILLMLFPFLWRLIRIFWLDVISFLIFLVVWVVIIYPSAQYLVYEACINNVKKGWHKKGMQYWCRPLMLALIIGIAAFALTFIWDTAIKLLFMHTDGKAMRILRSVLDRLYMICLFVFTACGNAAIFAEEKISNGFRNFLKAGRMHFMKLFAVVFVAALPYSARYVLSLTDFRWSSIPNMMLVVDVGSSLWLWIMVSFVSVFAMHCYLDYKDHEEIKWDLPYEENIDVTSSKK